MSGAGVDQKELWNGEAGTSWVEQQEVFDAMFAPITDALVAYVKETGAKRILDVGCGPGGTTRAMGAAVGAGADCVGLDISEPMIAAARANAAQEGAEAEYVVADAQTHGFDAGRFDAAVSRFGVMFFDDPVAAFANLRGAVREGGGLRAYTWRHPRDNAFMTVAGRTAKEFVPDMPKFDPEAPGQFGLCEEERVRRVLGEAGWRDVELAPFDFECVMPAGELIPFFTTRGPLGQVFSKMDAETQARVVEALEAAFAEYVDGDKVRYTAATWEVSARA